eukprot:6177769-Pleurochrysis_carterae.AAC.1
MCAWLRASSAREGRSAENESVQSFAHGEDVCRNLDQKFGTVLRRLCRLVAKFIWSLKHSYLLLCAACRAGRFDAQSGTEGTVDTLSVRDGDGGKSFPQLPAFEAPFLCVAMRTSTSTGSLAFSRM